MGAVADAQGQYGAVAKSKKQHAKERIEAERQARDVEIRERAGPKTAAKYAAGKIPNGKKKSPKQGAPTYFDGGRLQSQRVTFRTGRP